MENQPKSCFENGVQHLRMVSLSRYTPAAIG